MSEAEGTVNSVIVLVENGITEGAQVAWVEELESAEEED